MKDHVGARRLARRAVAGNAALAAHRRIDGAPLDFKVFSQNGEDGILSFLCDELGIGGRPFVEFGFGATENNTLLYAIRTKARGLYIDGSAGIEHARSLYRRIGINANVVRAWVDAESINDIISSNLPEHKNVAILSIDLARIMHCGLAGVA